MNLGQHPALGDGSVSASAGFVITLAITLLIYSQGIGTPLHFDTEANLSALATATRDLDSALLFIFGGDAGPSGRPVALASFLVNAAGWPADTADFVRTNILIHLLNTCLIAWLGFLIARARAHATRTAAWIGVATALLWATSPLLLSATFLIIQRMATLSALFVLLGLIFHLKFRSLYGLDPNRRLMFLSINLGLFTILATFSKENGALLPVLVLVMEWLLLARPDSIQPRHWAAWRLVFLKIPTLLLIMMLVLRGFYAEADLLRREFDGLDRLLTQAVVLWKYVWAAIGLDAGLLNPFLDNQKVYRSLAEPTAALAVFAWLVVITCSVVWRKRFALISFAVLWFIAAHLIESTTIPLEMVFQHRNYLPFLGIAIALPLLAIESRGLLRIAAISVAAILLAVGGSRSLVEAELWGDPERSAEYWYEQNPTSDRATSFLLEQLIARKEFNEALSLARSTESSRNTPQKARYKLMQILMVCDQQHNLTIPSDLNLDQFHAMLRETAFSFTVANGLRMLSTQIGSPACPWLNRSTVDRFLEATLENPRFSGNSSTNFLLNRSRAILAAQAGNWANAIRHYETALEAIPALNALDQLALLHVKQESFQAGCEYLAHAYSKGPRRLVQRQNWQQRVRDLFAYLGNLSNETEQPCQPWPAYSG